MRLSELQKAAVLAARSRPGQEEPRLVRLGTTWACVWKEPALRQGRWRGQLVKEVKMPSADEVELLGSLVQPAVWWSGTEVGAKTRRLVVEQLQAEALVL